MSDAITLSDLVVHRGPRRVLHDLSFSVPLGSVTGLLGPSGSGKTTAMRALVGSPEVLILDEPTVGLDPVLRVELWERFHALAAAGTTLVVSSHVMDEAGRCDRLVLLRDGRLVADTTPAQLRADGHSDDLEVAFLNLVRAREEVAA